MKRGGLGRGLSSLIPGAADGLPAVGLADPASEGGAPPAAWAWAAFLGGLSWQDLRERNRRRPGLV